MGVCPSVRPSVGPFVGPWCFVVLSWCFCGGCVGGFAGLVWSLRWAFFVLFGDVGVRGWPLGLVSCFFSAFSLLFVWGPD